MMKNGDARIFPATALNSQKLAVNSRKGLPNQGEQFMAQKQSGRKWGRLCADTLIAD